MLGWATNAKQMSTASKKLLSLRGVIFVMRNYFFPRHLVEGRHLLVQMWTTRPVRNWGAGSRHLNNYEINRHQCILQSEQHNKAVLRSRAFFPRLQIFFSRLRLRVKKSASAPHRKSQLRLQTAWKNLFKQCPRFVYTTFKKSKF